MYTQYFGFSKAPFKITPDPEFFFPGGNRGAVLEAVAYALSRGEGIVKVVGEVGSGKTMLCRMLERELPGNCEIVYLANPRLTPDEILFAIAFELKVSVVDSANRLEVMHALQQYLVEKHANDKRIVVFIEEAQGMPVETLEEIRILSNLETTQDKLLQIVLFGQPELNEKLEEHDIRQLKERITYRFELLPFKQEEIRDYINTRIRTSGYRGPALFSPGAIKRLSRVSKGLIRRINILADKALLAAFSRNDRIVQPRHVRMAARDSEFAPNEWLRPLLVGCAAAVIGLGLYGSWVWRGAVDAGGAPENRRDAQSPTAAQATVVGETADIELRGSPGAPAEHSAVVEPAELVESREVVEPAEVVESGQLAEPIEIVAPEVKYTDIEAIAAIIEDDRGNITDVSESTELQDDFAGFLSRGSIKPDLRPYLRLGRLREQLLGDGR